MSTYEGNGTLVICGRGVTYGAGKGTVEAARLQVGASRKQLCRRYAARLNFSCYPGLAPGANTNAAASRLGRVLFERFIPPQVWIRSGDAASSGPLYPDTANSGTVLKPFAGAAYFAGLEPGASTAP